MNPKKPAKKSKRGEKNQITKDILIQGTVFFDMDSTNLSIEILPQTVYHLWFTYKFQMNRLFYLLNPPSSYNPSVRWDSFLSMIYDRFLGVGNDLKSELKHGVPSSPGFLLSCLRFPYTQQSLLRVRSFDSFRFTQTRRFHDIPRI